VITFASPRRSPKAGSSVSGKKIVLDPGHGGSDSGATQKTANGTLLEKEQNLIVANKLKGLLEGSGATVCMTRTTDKALSNTQRYEYANSTGADILVSLHMNGSKDPKVDYTNVLYGKWYKDRDLANAVFKQLSTLLVANGTGTIATRAPYQYSSGVLFKSNMPAVMAESVFITNTDEGKLLLNEDKKLLSLGTEGRKDQIAHRINQGGGRNLLQHHKQPYRVTGRHWAKLAWIGVSFGVSRPFV
jgi:N-acetylmuramoyl-L-alanine amidase